LGPDFYDPVKAAPFPKTQLRYRNNHAARSVGLDHLSDAQWVEHFGKFKPLADNLPDPLALRYHGHQFQNYNPDLGDGRGFLFAQLADNEGRLLDLGTKGSGQTPYSRQGDGRLTLLGGIREVLATRYLEYLGVNTSRSFSLIETGEALQRSDEPSPTRASVLVRLSHSHIRFGSFQRQAFFKNTDNLEKLIAYASRYFYPNRKSPDEILSAVVEASADMVAGWMAAGFVHGVMNTDNMNLTGESFDYGPFRFLPTLQSGFTAAYFDHNGLYAFGRQPEVMYWNLVQLAQSLSLICEDKKLRSALEGYGPAYRKALQTHVFRRLSLAPQDLDADIDFISQTFRFLEASQASWPQFWHDWAGGAKQKAQALSAPNAAFYQGDDFRDWFNKLKTYEVRASVEDRETPPQLLYEDITALWEPIDTRDDWSEFTRKLESFDRV